MSAADMQIKKETFRSLPDGKSILPAKCVINKMGSSVVVSFQVDINEMQEGAEKTTLKQKFYPKLM